MKIKARTDSLPQIRPMAPSFDDRPLIVIWEITRSCALACRHCRAEAIPRRDPRELQGDEVEAFLDQVAEIQPLFFVLTGGDPANRSDLAAIVASATRRGLRVAISPSATPRLVHSDFHKLRAAGVERLSLSLDGASQATHDAFRGVPGTWAWTYQAIDKARAAGIEVQINTTFSRTNIGEFAEFLQILEAIQPSLWSVFLLVPTGRATANEMLSPGATEKLFEGLVTYSEHCGFPIKTTEGPHYRRVLRSRNQTQNPWSAAATNDGKGFVFISHTGEIQPSGFLPLTCGNVRTDNLLSVYRESPVFQSLRDPEKLRGKCGYCEYRQICGGSRARAYAFTGDWLAEDPSCSYQPKFS